MANAIFTNKSRRLIVFKTTYLQSRLALNLFIRLNATYEIISSCMEVYNSRKNYRCVKSGHKYCMFFNL